jgi:PAS domain S-box-containing protein
LPEGTLRGTAVEKRFVLGWQNPRKRVSLEARKTPAQFSLSMTRTPTSHARLFAIVFAAIVLEAAATVPFAIWYEDLAIVAAFVTAGVIASLIARYAGGRERERDRALSKLGALEATTSDGLIEVDSEGRVLAWNAAADHLLGVSGDDGTRRPAVDLGADDGARNAIAELIRSSASAQRPLAREAILTKADGGSAVFRVAAAPMRIGDETDGALIAVADADEARRAERRLSEARAKYDALLEQLPVIAYLHPPGQRGAPLSVSAQVSRVLGYAQEECIGRPLLLVDAIHPEDRVRVEDEVAAVREHIFRSEYRLVAKSGRIVDVADIALTIRDDDARPLYTQGVLIDLTDRRRAEEERERLLARADVLRDESSKRQARLELVAEASRLLSSQPDTEVGLERVAALAVRSFADWCTVDLVDEDGRARRLIALHGEPRPAQATDPSQDVDSSARDVARTGTPLLEEDRISVPLVSRGRVVGVFTFVATAPGRTYGVADLTLAEHLARIAGLAVDTGRLSRQVQEGAEAARVLTYVGDGLLLLDQSGIVRLWNPAAEAIIEVSAEDVLGRSAADVIPGWRSLADRIPVATAPEPSEPDTLPIETERGERWVSISGVEFFGGTVYAFRDVTAAHRLDELKAEFVATASHELRTPLAAVYGAAQTLRRHDFALDESGRERFVTLIVEESDRLSRIVNEILLANQLDAGRLDLFTESFDPVDLVERVAEAARARAPAGVTIFVDAPDAVPTVAADRDKVRQVLVNLVENAVKYSPDGGKIEMGVEAHDTTVQFLVRDEGLGIPPDEQEQIFEKFYRLDPGMTRGVGGTGLGLYICRELVVRMGGQISVDSVAGAGSTFTFELPSADSTPSRAGVTEDKPSSVATG